MMPAATTAGRRRAGGQTKTVGRLISSWGLLTLLLASNTRFAGAVCEEAETACDSDETCVDCSSAIDGAAQEIADNQEDCAARYPDSFLVGSDGPTSSFCEQAGASYCCVFDNTDTAEKCLANSATRSYWNCLLEDSGCSVDDLPCYSSSDDDALPVESEDDDPSVSTAPSPSFDDDVFAFNCNVEILACAEDDECQACISSADSNGEDCTDRYPDAYETSNGDGGSGTFCDVLGAGFCCEFNDNDAAETCMENEVVSKLFDCLVSDRGCSSDYLPCAVGDETSTTPSPTTDDATSAPSAGDRGIPSSSSSSTTGDQPSVSPTASPTVTISDSPMDVTIVTISPTTDSRGIFMTTSPTSSPTTDYTGAPTLSPSSFGVDYTSTPSATPTWSSSGSPTGGPSSSPSSSPTLSLRDLPDTLPPLVGVTLAPTVSAGAKVNVAGSRAAFLLAGVVGLFVAAAGSVVV